MQILRKIFSNPKWIFIGNIKLQKNGRLTIKRVLLDPKGNDFHIVVHFLACTYQYTYNNNISKSMIDNHWSGNWFIGIDSLFFQLIFILNGLHFCIPELVKLLKNYLWLIDVGVVFIRNMKTRVDNDNFCDFLIIIFELEDNIFFIVPSEGLLSY